MVNRIIIPSAKIVSEELQKIGKLPAVIYPINSEIVFDYLYKQYSDIADEITVVCHEKSEKVHNRLEKYKDEIIQVADLPELGDLLQTILFALSDNDQSVIINFGDTIVMDNLLDEGTDSFFYSEDYYSQSWTYFEIADGVLKNIVDKKQRTNNKEKGKLFVGVFSISNAQYFKNCAAIAYSKRDAGISAFYQALQLYSEKYPLKAIKTDNWFDIGHIDKYYNTKLEVKAREFNHITIDKSRGILTKYSDDKDKFIGEIKWYLKLPADVEYVRPRIFDYSLEYNKPFVSMEYYDYHTVHELLLYGALTYKQWSDIFKRILFICNDFKRYSVMDDGIKNALEEIYLTKTLQRFDKLKCDDRFKIFFSSPIIVNGIKYKSLDTVTELLKITIPDLLYDVKSFNIIHGDLCFANMMIDDNYSFIKVIDPRGKFGKYDIYGDVRYELAKLFHSVDGKYDYIIKDLFDVEYDAMLNEINFRIQDGDREFDLYSLLLDVFSDEIGDDLKKIELIEALLFLSMIPLHGESFNHQLVMLGTGLEILNRVVEIEVK